MPGGYCLPWLAGRSQHCHGRCPGSLSVREIEAHYAAFILDHSNSLARRTLFDTAVPVMADDVLHSKAGALA